MGRGTPCWEELILAPKTCTVVGPSTKSGLCKAAGGNGRPATALPSWLAVQPQLEALAALCCSFKAWEDLDAAHEPKSVASTKKLQ